MYLTKLCSEKGITINELSDSLGLDPILVSDIDIGLTTATTGIYYHKIKDYFKLDSLKYLQFCIDRDKKIQSWKERIGNDNLTDDERNAIINEELGIDIYFE